ncbi:MAG: VOC family protein [Rhodobacteraceae bacterium]|nr:VOC family protein [Paracoccaceae bacterium]
MTLPPRIDAIAVASTDLRKTAAFYELIGFTFADFADDAMHLEPETAPGDVRLMIDTFALMEKLIGAPPRPSNHSSFALLCADAAQLNTIAQRITDAGHALVKEPWDAFWGQRYAVLADPDGYRVDLFAPL